ncbi:hypothetical protein ANCDUO_11191 [Ancylostoma duodenale]|uniref:Uncharacterized protein n=1 Tax=Ancylostoma duodenale TaxID=51022 RepID=A0A0C2GI84_9BILA|nr:hypothetical protein ANCDUO_11191 [Ancylostoma duodenale]
MEGLLAPARYIRRSTGVKVIKVKSDEYWREKHAKTPNSIEDINNLRRANYAFDSGKNCTLR